MLINTTLLTQLCQTRICCRFTVRTCACLLSCFWIIRLCTMMWNRFSSTWWLRPISKVATWLATSQRYLRVLFVIFRICYNNDNNKTMYFFALSSMSRTVDALQCHFDDLKAVLKKWVLIANWLTCSMVEHELTSEACWGENGIFVCHECSTDMESGWVTLM